MTCARYLLERLQAEGVKYVFGIPGGGVDELSNSFWNLKDLKFILVKHEQNGAFMATGYAAVSGRPGAVMGTSGPGAWNALAGLDVAYANSYPVLALCGETLTKGWGTGGFQDSSGWGPRTPSQAKAFEGCTKWRVTVDVPNKVIDAASKAFDAMLLGRKGPVHIQIPVDVQNRTVVADPPKQMTMPMRTGGDPELIDKASELLANASSPAILAGWGVIESGASPELVELAELLTAPVATTFRGKGSIPEDHELALGVSGAMGHDTANGYLTAENVDVLLAVGAGFSQQTTFGWKKNYGGQKIIQVDVDPQGMCRVYNIELGIVGDAKIVLRSLVKRLRQANKARNRERLEKILKLKERMNYYSEPVMSSDAVPIKPPRAISEIRKALPRDAIVLTDCGNNCIWVERFYQTYVPGTLIFDGTTHMGWTAAAVIGAKLAAPDRPVVTVLGDGSFTMCCQDVKTAATYNVPAIWCILDDQQLGAIRHRQRVMPGRVLERYARLDLDNPDFVKFAEAAGIRGERVEKPGEIQPAVKRAIESNRPSVIDIMVDREEPHPAIEGLAKIVTGK